LDGGEQRGDGLWLLVEEVGGALEPGLNFYLDLVEGVDAGANLGLLRCVVGGQHERGLDKLDVVLERGDRIVLLLEDLDVGDDSFTGLGAEQFLSFLEGGCRGEERLNDAAKGGADRVGCCLAVHAQQLDAFVDGTEGQISALFLEGGKLVPDQIGTGRESFLDRVQNVTCVHLEAIEAAELVTRLAIEGGRHRRMRVARMLN